MKLVNVEEDVFDELYQNVKDHNFWQSLQMADFEKKRGWNVHYLNVVEKDTSLGCVLLISRPVILGYSFFYCARGGLIDYEDERIVNDFLDSLKQYCKQHKCFYLQCVPYWEYQKHDMDGNVMENTQKSSIFNAYIQNGFSHAGFTVGSDNHHEPRWISVLDLDKDKDEMLKSFDRQTRQNIMNTMKTGIQIERLQRNELYRLHDMVAHTGDRRHFLNPDLEYYESFMDSFQDSMQAYCAYLDTNAYRKRFEEQKQQLFLEKEHILSLIEESPSKKNYSKLLNCENKIKACQKRIDEAIELQKTYGDRIDLASAMFVLNDYEIVYLFSGSNEEFKHFKAAYALQWHMIQYGIDHHISRYNFYGISGVFDANDPEYGVYLFKKGFGANVLELPGEFTWIAKPILYSLYQGLKKLVRR